MSAAVHPLLSAIPRRLGVHPEWVSHQPEGTRFLAGETGCWLSVRNGQLHVEVRLALEAWDVDAVVDLCDDMNHYACVGRWVHDLASGVVALVTDLALSEQPAYDVENVALDVVAEMLAWVARHQYHSVPQRHLGALKATPALHGRFPRTLNAPPAPPWGEDDSPEVARVAAALAQDLLVIPLLGWAVQASPDELVADQHDGQQVIVRAAQHPYQGWGLIVTIIPPWSADPQRLSEYNNVGARPHGHHLGRWTTVADHVEYRCFLRSSLLQAAGGPRAGAQLVADIVTALVQHQSVNPGQPSVEQPVWPADSLALTKARREPWNDVFHTGDQWAAAYLDRFDRQGLLTEPSYRSWRERLLPEDLDDPRTAQLIELMQAQFADRDTRPASPAAGTCRSK